jgi:Domain of unknown function (DUF4410)
MKKIVLVILATLVVVLPGCVTPQVITPVPATVDLRQFKDVTPVVVDGVNTPFSREGLPMFEGLLKGRLQSAGYTLVDSNAEMVVEVTVHEFSPGDRALRMTVGFGAGRALLKYTAQFKDAHGHLLAQLEGGKAYQGAELVDNPTFKSDESTRMGLISYSVSQIGEFIQSNGRAGPAGGPAVSDRIGLAFDMQSGQLIPSGLPHPENWVYLGIKTVPGKVRNMTWVKPADMPPRQYQRGSPSLDHQNAGVALALLDKPQVGSAPEWSELFEYLEMRRPAMSAQEYLVGFTEQLKSRCPSSSVTPILVSSTELLLEIKSGGCELYGDRDEIDCFLFGETHQFNISYVVKSREMNPEQRESGVTAVTTWKIKPN